MLALPIVVISFAAVLPRPVCGDRPRSRDAVFSATTVDQKLHGSKRSHFAVVGAVVVAESSNLLDPTPNTMGSRVGNCALCPRDPLYPSTLDKTLATDQTLVLVACFLLACALVTCENLADVRLLTAVLLLAGCVMCVEAFSSSSSVTNYGILVKTTAIGVFQSPNELGSLAAMLLMVALGVVLSGLPGRYRVLGAITVALAVAALTLSLSRDASARRRSRTRRARALHPLGLACPDRRWTGRFGSRAGLGSIQRGSTEVQTLQSRFGGCSPPGQRPV